MPSSRFAGKYVIRSEISARARRRAFALGSFARNGLIGGFPPGVAPGTEARVGPPTAGWPGRGTGMAGVGRASIGVGRATGATARGTAGGAAGRGAPPGGDGGA